jgi:hypothetical protein
MAPFGFGGVLSTRERPTLTLDHMTGAPIFLTNGVSALGFDRSARHRDWAFTLVQAIRDDDNSPAIVRLAGQEVTVKCPDKSDCTKPLQAALSDKAVDHVIVPAEQNGEPWAVGPLFIYRSNVTLTLAAGVVLYAKEGEFQPTSCALLTIKFGKNVSLIATGATLRMRKMEYLPPRYTKAEWRHTLLIAGASDVAIIGGTYLESGGDGILIGGGGGVSHSHNVLLSGVTTDRAWRNGLSVISVINLTVHNSTFKNTNGTNPQCGIDLVSSRVPPHPLK